MAANKYYAIKYEGGKHTIVRTWDECKALTQGVSGVQYKKFDSEEDALNFMAGTKPKTGCDGDGDVLDCYVDGSYCDELGAYGSGVCILKQGEIIDEISVSSAREDLVSMRNVAGEVEAALEAIKYASERGYNRIKIYYDYTGIRHWALGEWKTNKEGTKYYAKEYKRITESYNVDVEFVKVAAHSGNKYNDHADMLAKRSLGI